MPTIITRGAASAKAYGFTGATGAAPGSQSYTTPGTYSWVAPAGVTSVSVVAIGGGQGGAHADSSSAGFSGSGAGLGYVNNYSVTPGNSYCVVVGSGGLASCCPTNRNNGTNSYFVSTSVVKGGLGAPCGGTFTGTGGGNGGKSNNSGGGSGAGGYSGAGGKGADNNCGVQGTAGAGGGGGGGSASRCTTTSLPWSNYAAGGGGGGTGLFGQGSNGAYTTSNFNTGAAVTSVGGCGGSCGGNGSSGGTANNWQTTLGGAGGTYGGGGGAGGLRFNGCTAAQVGGASAGKGQNGAVRIVWPGATRQFPSTCVGNP